MSTFVDYYNASKKVFVYTIKLAENDVNKDTLDKLKEHLARYNLKSMTPVKKTPIQRNPLDFPNIRDCEVYITDVVLEYPITPDALQREVSQVTKISEQAVAIYSENDPRKQYEIEWNERIVDHSKFVDNYTPKLGNPEKWETEPDYGEKYNTLFLKSLQDTDLIGKDTEEVTNSLVPPAKVDTVTVTGEEQGSVNDESILKDLIRNKNINQVPKDKNTMMSTPAKKGK